MGSEVSMPLEDSIGHVNNIIVQSKPWTTLTNNRI